MFTEKTFLKSGDCFLIQKSPSVRILAIFEDGNLTAISSFGEMHFGNYELFRERINCTNLGDRFDIPFSVLRVAAKQQKYSIVDYVGNYAGNKNYLGNVHQELASSWPVNTELC